MMQIMHAKYKSEMNQVLNMQLKVSAVPSSACVRARIDTDLFTDCGERERETKRGGVKWKI